VMIQTEKPNESHTTRDPSAHSIGVSLIPEIISNIKQRIRGTVSFFLRSGDLNRAARQVGNDGGGGRCRVAGRGHVETVLKTGVFDQSMYIVDERVISALCRRGMAMKRVVQRMGSWRG
jgi:hypothetical protein